MPAWAPALMALWGRPSKPSLRQIVEDELAARLPEHVRMPSYRQALRFIASLDAVTRNRGRLGPKALKSLRGYVKRSFAELEPLDVVTADGHTAKFRVGHPVHGRPFKPELTSIVDIKTRKAIGWWASLKEHGLGVVEALGHAIETHGLPRIFYTDNGPGYKARVMTDREVGFFARHGITPRNSLPYNSQARGASERSHKSLWIRPARLLPAYAGRDMDREAQKKLERRVKADLAAKGGSELLMTWPGFLAWAERAVDDYNARPHRGLPRVLDPVTGKLRHQSPNEAWLAALDTGWQPERLAEGERELEHMPRVARLCSRCIIRWLGNEYYAAALDPYHGKQLQVAYDIHDGRRVWVAEMSGRFICMAEADGHARPYFPQSAVVSAAEAQAAARARNRLRTVRAHEAEIEAELGPRLIEASAEEPLSPEQLAAAERQLAAMQPAAEATRTWNGRPFFATDGAYVAWIKAHPDELTGDDVEWLAERMRSWEFRMLHDLEGVELPRAAAHQAPKDDAAGG
jgi:putative transposase